jgi:hypothetical protein
LALLEDVGAKPVEDNEKEEEDDDYPSYDNSVISPPRSIFHLLTIPALRACRTKTRQDLANVEDYYLRTNLIITAPCNGF